MARIRSIESICAINSQAELRRKMRLARDLSCTNSKKTTSSSTGKNVLWNIKATLRTTCTMSCLGPRIRPSLPTDLASSFSAAIRRFIFILSIALAWLQVNVLVAPTSGAYSDASAISVPMTIRNASFIEIRPIFFLSTRWSLLSGLLSSSL